MIIIMIIIIITTIITIVIVIVIVIVIIIVVVVIVIVIVIVAVIIILIIIILILMVMVMVIITTITSIITITRLASSLSLLLCAAVMIRVVSYCCECSALFFFQPSDLASVITIVAMISAETPVALVFPVDMLWSEDLIETFFAVKRSLQDADDLFEEGVIEDPQNSALCQICQQVSVCLGSQTCGVFSMTWSLHISTSIWCANISPSRGMSR